MEARAVAKWIHRGPRKARKFIELIRGCTADEARAILGRLEQYWGYRPRQRLLTF